jgi:peptide/nickel transport system substrate-binding protein
MKSNSLKKAMALALGAAFVLSACTKAGGGVTEGGRANSWTVPHVLTMSTGAGDVSTLNPHLAQFEDVLYMASMTMAWLVKWDEHNNPYPELAMQVPTKANGGVSKDGLTITYHLRKGVKWSDGVPFDADDVVFTTKVVLDPATNEVGRLGWDQISKIDEPDKYTVVYHMKKPYSPFVETFFSSAGANPCILPKHLLASLPNINNAPYNALPVGIGPFKFESWKRGDQVVMVANPLYFRGRPKLDKVILKLIADRNTMLSQVQSHAIDLWYLVPGSYLPAIKQLPDYTIIRQPSYIFDHFDFNLQRPLDQDLAVRQAMRLAVDRNELLKKLGNGVGIVQDTTTPRNAPYAVNDLGVTPFDLSKANALLDQDGWRRGADGIRVKNGLRLVFEFAAVSGSQDVDKELELIRANWLKIGADIDVHHYASALFFAPIQMGGVVYGNKWDMIIFAWSNDAIGDYSPIYACQSFPPKGQNDLHWCGTKAGPAINEVFNQFEQSERNASVRTIQQEFVHDVPSIVMKIREDIFVHNKDLKNWHPNAITPFDNMMDVDI